MRNLKKILSLALALMMILSVTASAAFTDAAKIDADYAEAVAVLNGMEVFQGYEDGSFQPTKAITRAEVAAIVYRIATADVEDDKVALYVDSANFSDVKAADWFSGYVGYCTNAGYIKGYPDGTFQPNKTVTGFETLAMIMRAMGYDAENEFSGAQWSQNIAKIATKANILVDVKPGQLAGPATRELVAQLLFSAISEDEATIVKYVPAWGYVNSKNTLGEENFGLTKVDDTIDAWGRPGYGYVYNTGDEETYFSVAPEATYYTAVTECEVAEAGDFDNDDKPALYVNGKNSATFDVINPTDTIDTIGAQGRLTEVYEDRIVMIDTFLAKVTAVKDATYDARGHLKTSSQINLTIYDDADGTAYYATNGKTNYTYAAGDMVLVNTYAALAANKNEARDTRGAITATAGKLSKLTILGLAKSEVGAQSVIWYKQNQHTINGTTYADAAEFNLDKAGFSTSNYTWYFDQYGNVIGNTVIDTQYDYAVLKNIWWVGDATTGAGKAVGTLVYMDGTENVVTIGKIEGAVPNYSVRKADVMTIEGNATNGYKLFVATDAATNANLENGKQDFIQGHLFRVETTSTGAAVLELVEDKVGKHTESTDATILNKYAYITGTPTNIVVDANTKFLVRGKDSTTFKAYNGLNELPTFDADATVDYVMGTNAAKYVYIIGDVAASQNANFILVKGAGYSYDLEDEVYVMTLLVPAEDGSVVTIKTESEALKNKLMKNDSIGKLWYVTYEDGLAVTATAITTTEDDYAVAGETVLAKKFTQAYLTSSTGNVLTNGTNKFINITGATVVVGELKTDMTGMAVYVIYSNDGLYIAEKIYVLEKDEVQDPTVYPSDPTKGTVTYVVKMYFDGTLVDTATKTIEFEAKEYVGTETWVNIQNLFFQEIDDTQWTVYKDNADVTVVAGENVVVEYILKAK